MFVYSKIERKRKLKKENRQGKLKKNEKRKVLYNKYTEEEKAN